MARGGRHTDCLRWGMANDPNLHDHHERPASPMIVTPQAGTPHPGSDPLANNDPAKNVTKAQRVGAGLILVVALILLTMIALVTASFLFRT